MTCKADVAYILVFGVEPLASHKGDSIADQNSSIRFYFKQIKMSPVHPLRGFPYGKVLKGFKRAWAARDLEALKSADTFATYLRGNNHGQKDFKTDPKGFG